MRFDNASNVEQLVWQMRLADQLRGENRAILDRLYNGDSPYTDEEAEENDIQVNRNDLTGPNMISQARRQWYQAFLKPGNYFSVGYDSGTPHKRREWGHSVTYAANTVLKQSASPGARKYMEQCRATGATTLLHGIGPAIWKDRRSPVPRVIPISSVMVPSETELDFDNCSYFALFNEWTPAQLYSMTHGPRVDKGWNMRMVDSQMRYVKEQVMKQPNAGAFQYMPERIEQLIKQDMGMWASDAVPTIDVWDFYFREDEDGNGWYRRTILDWGIAAGEMVKYAKNGNAPASKNTLDKDEKAQFLYTSGKRKFANSLSEIIHFQFGDCSAVAPFRYHSVRSLGWMLWGVCDLENRLHCKFTESVFQQLMWFFRVSSDAQLKRLQMADFFHMGVIPQGVDWVKAQERFTPDQRLVSMAFGRFKQLMAENASSFTQDFDQGQSGKEMTATETMARVNQVNAMVSGMLALAYTYEEYKDAEVMRRLCLKGNTHPMAQRFRKLCLDRDVPPEMLDVDRMTIQRERTLGAGNKTLEMAQVQFLQGLRKNLGPDAQRRVDHISIESATDDANLAEDLAPVNEDKPISNSMHDAQLSTERLMRGLPFAERPDMVYEDYVKVWLVDLGLMVSQAQANGHMASAEQLSGFGNMISHIEKFIGNMDANPEDKERVRAYQQAVSKITNILKGFAQRLSAATKAKGQANGADPKDAARAMAMVTLAQTKAKLAEQSHSQKTAQRQVSFDLEQQRKEREHNSEMRRLSLEHNYEMLTGHVQRLAATTDRPTPETGEAE